jgi:hypothetical protein
MGKPSLTQKIINAAKAAGRVIEKGVDGGDILVSEETKNDRMALCVLNTCGFYDISNETCSACGCYLSQKAKLTTEECPMGYWGKV